MSSRETVRSTMVLVSVFSIRPLPNICGMFCGSPRLIYLNAVNGAASQIGQGAERRDDNTVLSANPSGIALFVLRAGHEQRESTNSLSSECAIPTKEESEWAA